MIPRFVIIDDPERMEYCFGLGSCFLQRRDGTNGTGAGGYVNGAAYDTLDTLFDLRTGS